MLATALIGLALVGLGEALLLLTGQTAVLLPVAGALLAVVLVALHRHLRTPPVPPPPDVDQDRREALERWRSRTEILISWSEGTRADWDQHLRPVLARELVKHTGQRHRGDRRAQAATGAMLFGPQLWPWVDPSDVAFTDHTTPAPGRAVLAQIIDRLERL